MEFVGYRENKSGHELIMRPMMGTKKFTLLFPYFYISWEKIYNKKLFDKLRGKLICDTRKQESGFIWEG